MLPSDTLFFGDGLSFDQTALEERCAKRRRWLDAGLRRIEGADIVFFRPRQRSRGTEPETPES